MGRIIVNVMPTPESVTERSDSIVASLAEHGMRRVTSVLPGRRYNIYVEGEATEADLELARNAVAALHDPATETITGVFIGSVHASEEDDWEIFEQGIGAIAPIPEGAGRHERRPYGHRHLDATKLGGPVDDYREYADDDSEDTPNSDPTKRL